MYLHVCEAREGRPWETVPCVLPCLLYTSYRRPTGSMHDPRVSVKHVIDLS